MPARVDRDSPPGGRLVPAYHRHNTRRVGAMLDNRNVEAVDRELELLTAATASIRRLGGAPSVRLVDELLDERLALSTPSQPR